MAPLVVLDDQAVAAKVAGCGAADLGDRDRACPLAPARWVT